MLGAAPGPQAAGASPPLRFQATCNNCTGRMSLDGVLTSCRHFLCPRCIRKADTCPVCNHPCRMVQLKAPGFPQEIKDRSAVCLEARTSKNLSVLKVQNAHALELNQRIDEITRHAFMSLKTAKQKIAEQETALREKRREVAELEDLAPRNEPKDQYSGGFFRGLATPGQDYYPPPTRSSANSSLFGKTLMH
ncbi:hypothetical protein DIPPA_22742 [Diplonema papillatum]|nr:hypothetical protein DIPPA_22742 [Diplonema papillatum]